MGKDGNSYQQDLQNTGTHSGHASYPNWSEFTGNMSASPLNDHTFLAIPVKILTQLTGCFTFLLKSIFEL